MTHDLYEINTSTDSNFLTEFPALKAQLVKAQNHQGKTEAQKEALKTLRRKFRYPTVDPQPNIFKDQRTELEKVQSILRTTSQILDKDNLAIWNDACERSLHMRKTYNSGIPVLKQNITDQIRSFRLQKDEEMKLLHKTDYFDKLQVPDPNHTSDSESKSDIISEQLLSESEQDIVSDMQHPAMLQAFSAIPLQLLRRKC